MKHYFCGLHVVAFRRRRERGGESSREFAKSSKFWRKTATTEPELEPTGLITRSLSVVAVALAWGVCNRSRVESNRIEARDEFNFGQQTIL